MYLEKNEWQNILWGENPLILKGKVQRPGKGLCMCLQPFAMIQARQHLHDKMIVVPILSFREKTSSPSTGLFSIAKGWTFPELALEPHHTPDLHIFQQAVSFKCRRGWMRGPTTSWRAIGTWWLGEKGQFSLVTWSLSGTATTLHGCPHT